MKIRKNRISSAITLVLVGAAFQAHGQETDSEAAQELDRVVVTGIRGSVQQSIDAQRESLNIVNVISAEDIADMPDKNVADSLSRVPGVNTSSASGNEGAFDERDRVSIRGTSPSLTQTLVNGHNVASGDWFILNQTGTVGRSVSYSLLPSELVQEVIVYKSSEAKLVEGGAAGSIDIRTRKPLEFTEDVTALANLGVVYADLPGEYSPQFSGLVNYKNDAGNFGIMVQAFSETRQLRRDGQEILGYNVIAPTDEAAVAHPDLAGVLYPSLIGSALFEQERKRQGGMISLDFKAADNLNFGLNYFTSTLEADNYNRNYMLWGAAIIQRGAVPDAGYVIKDNTLVSANFTADPDRQYGIYDQISRPGSESSSEFVTFDMAWDVNDKVSLTAQVGSSNGSGKTPTQDVAEWDVALGTGAGWQLNGIRAADWNLGSADTSQPGVPGTDIRLDWIFGLQDVDVKDEEDWVQIDGEYFMDKGIFTTVDFGVRNAEHTRGLNHAVAQGPGCAYPNGESGPLDWGSPTLCGPGGTAPFDPANWPVGYQNYPGDFGSGLGGNFPRDIWYFSPEQLAQYNRMTNRDPVTRFYFPALYNLEEGNTAAYAQFNFENGALSGNFGLRWVQTREDITNYVNADAADPDAITTSAFGPYKTVLTENTYNNWLPSLNLRWEVNEDWVGRFAASQTLSLPDYSALAGAVSLSPPAVVGGVGTGTGGNPNLEPIISTNFDATVEWYFAPNSQAYISLFYMDLDNYVALGTKRVSYLTIDQNNPTGAYVDYDLVIPLNSGAEVNGVELSWIQAFNDNWGAFANYTYADSDTDDGAPMLGTSKNTYNVGGYFENDVFNARVAYTYRSSFYSGLDRNTAFFQDDVGNLSASLGWEINEHVALSLDGLNLNNPKTKYYADSNQRPRSIYESGVQYYLNLTLSY